MPSRTDATPAAVTYIGLPLNSGGAHSLGRMSRRVAFERTTNFLEVCTRLSCPVAYEFQLNEFGLGPLTDIEDALEERFGGRRAAPVSSDRVGDALNLLDELDPQPTASGIAPLWFWMRTTFQLIDPDTREPFAGQDPDRFCGVEYDYKRPLGTSSLRLILSNRAVLGVELCIPDADDERLAAAVPFLQSSLPFKFSTKQWKEWTPTKTGRFKGRRTLAPPTS